MTNNLVDLLKTVIGSYNYDLAPFRIGIASLDYEYFARLFFLIFMISFIFKMFLIVMKRR